MTTAHGNTRAHAAPIPGREISLRRGLTLAAMRSWLELPNYKRRGRLPSPSHARRRSATPPAAFAPARRPEQGPR